MRAELSADETAIRDALYTATPATTALPGMQQRARNRYGMPQAIKPGSGW
jgi:hypothetical protein